MFVGRRTRPAALSVDDAIAIGSVLFELLPFTDFISSKLIERSLRSLLEGLYVSDVTFGFKFYLDVVEVKVAPRHTSEGTRHLHIFWERTPWIDIYIINNMSPQPKKSKRIRPSTSANNAAAAMEMEIDAADRLRLLLAAPETETETANAAAAEVEVVDNFLNDDPNIQGLSNKLTATILGFLGYKDIMRSRICCRKIRDAARTTLVPWTDDCYHTGSYSYSHSMETQIRIKSVQKYKAIVAMTSALPNLQHLKISGIYEGRNEHKYCDGVDPDEEWAAKTAKRVAHDIQVVSNFRQLRHLVIESVQVNGKYPVFFNFPLLQKLEVNCCSYMKWDLKMLAGLPSLKELNVSHTPLTGNIKSLLVLKNTLERVCVCYCFNIEGNFIDLADFPLLKYLNLPNYSLVTGDMRDICENDFPMLETLNLWKGVIGYKFHEFQRIADVPSVAEAIYRLKQMKKTFIPDLNMFSWSLSRDSPEWYASNGERGHPDPPFSIDFVQAGSRVGWRWKISRRYNRGTNSCEINWLGPEPDRESSDYEVYSRELQSLQEDIFCFEGYHQPPSQDEYKRLCEEYYGI